MARHPLGRAIPLVRVARTSSVRHPIFLVGIDEIGATLSPHVLLGEEISRPKSGTGVRPET
jgi:hypothetical protein